MAKLWKYRVGFIVTFFQSFVGVQLLRKLKMMRLQSGALPALTGNLSFRTQ